MVYRGVSTQLPLIKIIGILILQLTLFVLFSSLLLSRTFFAISLAEKMHPLFSASHQSKIFSPAFSFVIIFTPLLMNMPITYIVEIGTTLLTLFSRILGFTEGKGR
jgi:hypothetical protein